MPRKRPAASKVTPPPLAPPALTITQTPVGLRLQSSLDYIADGIGGRASFLQACQLCSTDEAKTFMAAWRGMDDEDQRTKSLQDICVGLDISPLDLLSQVIAASVLAQNNISLWLAALQRPAIMQASITKALDVNYGGEERRMQFEMAELLRGGGTVIQQINQLGIQVRTPEGALSFEDDAARAVMAVRDGKPLSLPAPQRPELELNPESEILEGTAIRVPASLDSN